MTDTPPRPAASLSARLFAGAVVWLVVMLMLGGSVLTIAFRDTVEREFSSRLDAMLRGMIAAADIAPNGTVSMTHSLGDPRFEQIFSGWYWQITEAGGRQIRSRSLWDSALTPSGDGTEMHSTRRNGPKGEPLLVVERDLTFPGADGFIHLMVAGDLREVSDSAQRFTWLLWSALGLLGLGMAVAIVIQIRFGLRPLRNMAADLDAVHRGKQHRLSGAYPQEVAPLVAAMNGVLDKDAELIERARNHVGNLAHGLKTPLAVVSAEMAATPDKRVVVEQVQVMRRLIEHHLGRASAVAGAGRAPGAKVSVREAAQNIAAVLNRIFADRAVDIRLDVADDVWFYGHAEDLEEILGNLMENACKWASSQIRVTAHGESRGLELCVEDDGPGLSPELAEEAACRGKRFDEMSPGWGLGLSIVADLVEVNGGEMAFTRSALGGLSVAIHISYG